MKIRITKVRPTAVIPAYATEGSAAFDLTSAVDTTVPARGIGRIPTGLIFNIPDDHVFHIFARSSTFSKWGIVLSNGVGVIDSDYCGPNDEILLLVYNPGDADVTIPGGTRIAQGIVYPRPRIDFEEGPAEGPTRGGFGSTG